MIQDWCDSIMDSTSGQMSICPRVLSRALISALEGWPSLTAARYWSQKFFWCSGIAASASSLASLAFSFFLCSNSLWRLLFRVALSGNLAASRLSRSTRPDCFCITRFCLALVSFLNDIVDGISGAGVMLFAVVNSNWHCVLCAGMYAGKSRDGPSE